jgi:hypothetical protein
VDRRHHAAAAAVSRLRQRRRAADGVRRPASAGTRPNPRDINDLLKTIGKVKPAFFNGIPTLYNAILNHPDVRAERST